MKKVVLGIVISLVVICILAVGLYFYGLGPVSKSTESVEYILKENTNKIDIINDLKVRGLIRSKFSGYIYVLLNRDMNLQAGKYELSYNMGIKKILDKINKGDIAGNQNIYNITFIEGKRLVDYAAKIATLTNTSTEDVMDIMNDPEYLDLLIDKYWFLTDDILNDDIYYPLEGYLFASTYEVYKDSGVKDIIEKMLSGMENVLNNYRDEIENSNYSVHEILTMASIVELEGAASNDRAGVAGVFYNRLKIGESLGSDVTTYYAVKKDFSSDLTNSDLYNCNNGYNTRGNCNRGKLPVGPICSASVDSILATIKPSKHDYLFFVADKNKKTYFTKTNAEHEAKVSELKANGLWYEYK